MSVAIITGAARGIGAATARSLAAGGWDVVLVDRCEDDPAIAYPLASRPELDAVAAQTGGIACVADVRDQAALDGAVALAVERYGRLDAAVAVAGVLAGGPPTWETDEAVWAAMVDVNLSGVWRLAKAAVPALLAAPEPRHGRFVAVSSSAGVSGLPRLAAYAASKHGVIGLVRSMAAELGPAGITVNAVAPGSTSTVVLDASAAVYGLAGTEEFAHHHQLARLLAPEEIAAVVAWVCSPDSSAVTGAVLPADAGMTAS